MIAVHPIQSLDFLLYFRKYIPMQITEISSGNFWWLFFLRSNYLPRRTELAFPLINLLKQSETEAACYLACFISLRNAFCIFHVTQATEWQRSRSTLRVRRDFGARLECHAPLSKPEKRIAKYFSFILNPLGSQIILHIHFVFCIASPALSELLSLDGSPLASCRFMKQLVLTERQPTHWAQS